MPSTVSGECDATLRIICVGESGAGKTSLIRRMVDGLVVIPPFQSPRATLGVDLSVAKVQLPTSSNVSTSPRVKLQLWDTGGQERFRSIITMFYRGAHGALIMCDSSRVDALEAVDYWHEQLQLYCPTTTIIFLVSTKHDMFASADDEFAFVFRAHQTAKRLGLAGYFSCSSLSTTHLGIHNIFVSLATQIVYTRAYTDNSKIQQDEEAVSSETNMCQRVWQLLFGNHIKK